MTKEQSSTPSRWWLPLTAVNISLLIAGATLVAVFIRLNLPYILSPESSPGYSDGTPFGDGGDVFRRGFLIAVSLTFWLNGFNAAEILLLQKDFGKQRHFLLAFAAIVIAECCLTTVFDSNVSTLASMILSIIPFGIAWLFGSLYALLLFPAIMLGVAFFLAVRKKRAFLPLAFLAVTSSASFALEWFSDWLYLD